MGIFYIAMNVFTAVQAYYFRYIVNDYLFDALRDVEVEG